MINLQILISKLKRIFMKKKKRDFSKVPGIILFTGKVLQKISKRLTTKFAVYLFTTPMKFKTPKRENQMAKSAQNQRVFVSEIQKEIHVYSYGYSKKKILLVHGWAGRGTQLYKIADKLLENGYMTISFDAPAHGKSDGKNTSMIEFIHSIQRLDEEYGPFEAAIGHSLGGMALLNAVRRGLKLKRLVTIGSGDIISEILKDFLNRVELQQLYTTRIKQKFRQKLHDDMDNFSGSVAARDVKIPTYVVHDTGDKEVPVSSAYNIRQNLQQGSLLITNKLGHNRILKDQNVVNRVVSFINAQKHED